MKYPYIIEVKVNKSALLGWEKANLRTVKLFKKEYQPVELRLTDQIKRTTRPYRAFIKNVNPLTGETIIQFVKE